VSIAASGNGNSVDVLKQLDESGITAFHWKILLVSGMGFFTDAYDLFIIGVVVTILKPIWRLSSLDISLVNSTALIASAIGAVLFGRIADMLGRKRIYGYEVLVLAAGAIASAFSPNITWLIVFRFILGIGIGGDYPVSATIMSGYACKLNRSKLVSLVFAAQAAGLIVGPLIAAGLLASGVSHDSEIFPVLIRTTGDGIAAGMGKIGGFIGVFTFPLLLASHGLAGAELAAAAVSLVGAVLTWFMLPEPNGKSLEELSPDEENEDAPAARQQDRCGGAPALA